MNSKELTLENIGILVETIVDKKLAAFKIELEDIFLKREDAHEYFNAVGLRFNEVTRRFEHDEKILTRHTTSIAHIDERVHLLET